MFEQEHEDHFPFDPVKLQFHEMTAQGEVGRRSVHRSVPEPRPCLGPLAPGGNFRLRVPRFLPCPQHLQGGVQQRVHRPKCTGPHGRRGSPSVYPALLADALTDFHDRLRRRGSTRPECSIPNCRATTPTTAEALSEGFRPHAGTRNTCVYAHFLSGRRGIACAAAQTMSIGIRELD